MQKSIPSGIQKHSQGSLFPAVIAKVERYATFDPKSKAAHQLGARLAEAMFYEQPLAARLECAYHELTLGAYCERYANREDAEIAARILLDGVSEGNQVVLNAVAPAAPFVNQQPSDYSAL